MESVLFEATNVKFEKGNEEEQSENNDNENEEVQLSLMSENELPTSCVAPKNFSRLPGRSPIDIKFENITFTASMGWRKGT